MTNYERMMQSMTVEQMAENNVHLITVDNRRLFYVTSSGQLFPQSQFEDAVRYEYAWLKADPEAEANECECCENESCDCEAPCENCSCQAADENAVG